MKEGDSKQMNDGVQRLADAQLIEPAIRIDALSVAAFKIPTDAPEADGTLRWNSTTLVLVEIKAGGQAGIGYTYAQEATAFFIQSKLKELVLGKNALDISRITSFLSQQIRNSGTLGLAMMAVSAIDNALWDLKAKILGLPLCRLLGQAIDAMPVYGSGGFTSYSKQLLQQQFAQWADEGIRYLKMKVGSHPENDVQRVKDARAAVPDTVRLMIDANGAYTAKEALEKAAEVLPYGVIWFEEPVSSDNRKGLRFIRERVPAAIRIAAGEYGYNLPYFQAMLAAGAVDVLQADATRCGGLSGFLKAGYLCEAHQLPFSSHCAPALHLHAALALPGFFLAEYFHDHVRIEQLLFDGVSPPREGALYPDLGRPGLGLDFKWKDAEKFKI